ncbi:hypothetical protein PIIN_02658 [Serendipita indica DSM 11827]|uniref:Autophagy-related protein 17 n=1 Tax=Serendipita indica (strain DSM 11827) TaxID=1109443 RepID=G4TBU4_SERID|nr:hypothetical protein PIIN_02658 [Serendipita indica DSM 11827]
MSTPTEGIQRDLLSLVLRSRKALDHTKTLCSRADVLSKDSTELALDLVAVDAKVRWANEMISDQLKLVGSIVKTLSLQRQKLERDAKNWDQKRKERTAALEALLDDLGSQSVPPSFYETASGSSSIFGSQPSGDEGDGPFAEEGGQQREPHVNKVQASRAKWKTLRSFVDEKAVEEAIERMDEDRNALEDLIESTSSQTQVLSDEILAIRNALPTRSPSVVSSVHDLLKSQESDLERMAQLLMDVTHHFDQMESALADFDAGEVLGEDDMEVLEGDTAELPSIIEETEAGLRRIENVSKQLKATKDSLEEELFLHRARLTALEALEVEISNLNDSQQTVEAQASELHATLESHLAALGTVEETYTHYRSAYGNLVFEMDRRQKYRETVDRIIHGMNEQLAALRQEELARREQFFKTEGTYIPEDLCPFVGDGPTIFEVNSAAEEVAVTVNSQYVEEVQHFLAGDHTKKK